MSSSYLDAADQAVEHALALGARYADARVMHRRTESMSVRNGAVEALDQITRPVKNLRFTQSYPEALAPGRALGIGAYAPAFASRYGEHSAMAPALHLAGWNFTGGARG